MRVLQDTSICGLKYIRFILERTDWAGIGRLKKRYSYIFFYVFEKQGEELKDFSFVKKNTPLIDLTQGTEVAFKRFRKNTRNEIRKTERIKGLSFRNLDNNFGKSYRFYKKIKRKDGVSPDLKMEFNGCLFFNAYLDGKIIVSVSCYDDSKETLRLKHIVSLRKKEFFDGRIAGYATRRIIWEICKYGAKCDYKTVDLGGINFGEPDKEGIRLFKESFGGLVAPVYIYHYETRMFKLLKKILTII